MMNTFISILVLCLSRASSQGIVDDLLCNKLGLLDGCDKGGLAADPSSEALNKKDDLVAKEDKGDIKPPAEKLSGNIKDDFHDDAFKGRSRNNRNDNDYGRDLDRYSRGYGDEYGSRGYRREGYGREFNGYEFGGYRLGGDYGRLHEKNSYSVYRRSLPKHKKVLRRNGYGSDYRGDFDYDNEGFRRFGHHDYDDFSRFMRDYNDDHHHNSYNYEY